MEKKQKPCSHFLFPTSTIMTGIGSIISIPGNYYIFNSSESGEIADANAIACDWMMVGGDMDKVMNSYAKKNSISKYEYASSESED